MPSRIRMANGVHIPFMGIGTGGKFSNDEETEKLLRIALDVGYRHIDTAQMYECEAAVGRVLQEYFTAGKLKREDVFVTTKLPPTANQPSVVFKCFQDQLKALQLEYVDLYLIHSPASIKCKDSNGNYEMKLYSMPGAYENDTSVDLMETWKEVEQIYQKGLAKAIGLSNFNVDQLQRIYSSATVKPMNLQIEVHLYWPQKELITLCKSLNITVTAYAPIGCPGKKGQPGWTDKAGPIEDPLVATLAEKYKKTTAQILLRHLTQRNIIVVPKSTNPQRIKENFELSLRDLLAKRRRKIDWKSKITITFAQKVPRVTGAEIVVQSSDFFLLDEDINALNEVTTRIRFYAMGAAVKTHPEYPFTDQL